MTNIQMIKLLDKAIDQSFRRSASDGKEQAIRVEIRKAQTELRNAHKNHKVEVAYAKLTRALYEMNTAL